MRRPEADDRSAWLDRRRARVRETALVALLPPSATDDARYLLLTRALRGFADGLVSVLLAGYLTRLGFTPFRVGALVTGTLLGSASLTTAVRLSGYGVDRLRG